MKYRSLAHIASYTSGLASIACVTVALIFHKRQRDLDGGVSRKVRGVSENLIYIAESLSATASGEEQCRSDCGKDTEASYKVNRTSEYIFSRSSQYMILFHSFPYVLLIWR